MDILKKLVSVFLTLLFIFTLTIPKQVAFADCTEQPTAINWYTPHDPSPDPESHYYYEPVSGLEAVKLLDKDNPNTSTLITPTVALENGNQYLTFVSTVPISYVYVKGGDIHDEGPDQKGTLYKFETPVYAWPPLPPKECPNALKLFTTEAKQNISHVTFYYSNLPPPPKGSLEVTKLVLPVDAHEPRTPAEDETFTFTLVKVDTQGNPIEEPVTKTVNSSNPSALFGDLDFGTYRLTEGYDTAKYHAFNRVGDGLVAIGENGISVVINSVEEQNVVIVNQEIEQEPQLGSLVVNKFVVPINGEPRTPVEGETFTFTLVKVDAQGNPVAGFEPITKTVNSSNPVASFTGLVFGTYRLTEEYDAAKYNAFNRVGDGLVAIGENGISIVINNVEEQNIEIVNREIEQEPQLGSLVANKFVVPVNGVPRTPAEGETFTFTLVKVDAQGNPVAGFEPITKTVNSSNPAASFTGLVFGTYRLTEGYDTAKYNAFQVVGDEYLAPIGQNGISIVINNVEEQNIEIINREIEQEPQLGSLVVNKFVAPVNGEPRTPVEGETFTFTLVKVDAQGNPVAGFEPITKTVNSSNPVASFTGLVFGTYRLTEGYDAAKYNAFNRVGDGLVAIGENGISVVINSVEEQNIEVINREIEQKPQLGSLVVNKFVVPVNGEPRTPAEGETFTFTLVKVDAQGNPVAGFEPITKTVNSSNPAASFTGLVFGTYRLTEGYDTTKYESSIADGINITIGEGENKVVNVTNTLKSVIIDDDDDDLPYTGGLFEPELLYAALGFLILLAGVGIKHRRN